MIRPVTILCLSDLHYDCNGDMHALNKLGVAFHRFVNGDIKRIKWEPDYIVIAGDVAQGEASYDSVGEFLNGFVENMPWLKDNIIIVPGNHDKQAPSTKEAVIQEREVFEVFCKDPIKNRGQFHDLYYSEFRSYLDFCQEFARQQ